MSGKKTSVNKICENRKDSMRRKLKFLCLLLGLLLGIAHARASAVFSPDALTISLEQGDSVFAGTWIADSEEAAFLLIGNEAEDEMRLAVALRADDDAYQIIARSEKIISCEAYRAGDVVMLDKWNNGNPYFWYSDNDGKNIYVSISKAEEDDWGVCYGYVESPEENFSYCAVDDEDAMAVYEIYSPKICWPIQHSMSLDGFDLSVVREECIAALDYLHRFKKTHEFGEQDATYTILWD